ncbi:MAG: phosphopyruvate hydratase [Patescibacteria group bacterium]
MPKIKTIKALEILDSRGNPTLETWINLDNGLWGKAAVPSGASTGTYEALELRDGDKKRYSGLGVLKAVENVNSKIFPLLKDVDVNNQEEIDQKMRELDGTDNKSNLGGNAILSVSLACARTASKAAGKQLFEYLREVYGFKKTDIFPSPMFNIFNGGKHADTNLDFQEFMVIPVLEADIGEKIRIGAEVFHELGRVLKSRGLDTDVGNEGGYAPNIDHSIQAIEMILEAISQAGFKPGEEVALGMDVGASTLFDKRKGEYIFKLDSSFLNSEQLIELYKSWLEKYPFVLIEDGLDEDDFAGWKILTKELGQKILLVGDDLFVTNVERFKKGISEKLANAILIKPNQIGTLTETVDCIKLAKSKDYKVVVSHRSGETNDSFIADLAFASNADFIKAGAPCRGERLAKYNRLLEIYES